MRKLYITLLVILIAVTFATAQQSYITIKGHVYNQQTQIPVAGQSMILMTDSLNSAGYWNKVVTDDAGFYSDKIPYTAGLSLPAITVSTSDCNGAIITKKAYLTPNSADITLDFVICMNQPPACVAMFKFQTRADTMLSVAFWDGSYSSGSVGTTFKYFWNFGDSTASTEQNPVHTYAQSGVYYVCLTLVNSNDSLCTSSFCLPVAVGQTIPDACQSSFWYYNDSTGNGYVFNASALNGQPDSWLWDFGDGTTATGQTVTHSFGNSNTSYKVCLTTLTTAPDGAACKATSCQDVHIYSPSPCESSFGYQPDTSGRGFIFEAYSKNKQVTTWTWDFGDGTTASGQTVTHSFADTKAEHYVCLTSAGSDASGATCTFSSCQNVYIYIPSLCESTFKYYPDSTGGFTFEGIAGNSRVSAWIWNFGDGTTANGQKVWHTFSTGSNDAVNNYACLTTSGISADGGDTCTFSSCQQISTNPPSPCENYFESYTADGLTYTFSGAVASGAAANYYWDFGDGTSGTGQQVIHSYTTSNTFPDSIANTGNVFTVCLTTSAGDPAVGNPCKNTSCQTIFTGSEISSCKAILAATPDSSGYTFHFQNLSQGNSGSVFWDFGDGITSSDPNPVHTYALPGIYFACLTIADSVSNCKNQACQEIWVNMIQPGCRASFAVMYSNDSSAVLNLVFLNSAVPGFTNQKWSFGDGTGSTGFNASHTYSVPGHYTVCLTIWNADGNCQNTYCADVAVGKVTGDNAVSGNVLAGNKAADQGIVWLISADNTVNLETLIDSTGSYHFTGVPPGKYYIYAMLTPGSVDFFAYMPTYYVTSLSWQGATLVNAGEPNGWYTVNLMPSLYWSQGSAVISGIINWSGKASNDGSPASNVEVVLFNNNGSPIAYTFTDSDGTFRFNNLPYGQYTLQAEMPGKATQVIDVTLSENNSAVNIDFRVNESAIYFLGINESDKAQLQAGNPFPNPVGTNLYLSLNAPAPGTAIADILDVQGRIIHSESIELSGGSNRISIATGNLTKGIYLLRIKSEGYQAVQRKFIR